LDHDGEDEVSDNVYQDEELPEYSYERYWEENWKVEMIK